ncbi:K02A2.6-like [Cordylochernes scorpioides]|uniref:K02A2.6-like n=1 Tax=Cordylochernes scorpioides TaxID=51811 RepID=A0ABY6LXW8_9ARAC|nr:K02A2.6-like [Cordylochernes scorpioides]
MPNFVKYHPTLNIKTWLINFELKCDSYNSDAQWRILHISDYLQDEALIYHYEILSNIGNWPEAKEKLINRFQKIEITPLVGAIKVYQNEQETISDYYHRKMKMINLVELPSKSIVELLNEVILKKYKPYLATIDTDQPLNWLTMATKIEKSLTGSGTPVEKGHLQTSNLALDPSPIPARYYDVGLINTISITFRLTTDTPIVQKPYRTSYANNTEINRQIHELLKYNIIRPSCSSYASPILLVQKKSDITGRPTRLCIDFRKLNLITKTENCPIPLIEEILDRFGNAKMLTSLDIKHAYWHILIAETHKDKTAFVCQQGCYEWNRMSYGLKMDQVFLIGNANIEDIKKLQRPYNMKTLQSFLGSINVYHKFIPQYVQIRAPLNTPFYRKIHHGNGIKNRNNHFRL